MANKKIWAYGKDINDDYITGEVHPLRIFYIWEVLKLKRENIHEFNKITFMSTQKDPSARTEMSSVIKGFFRYIKKPKQSIKEDKDSDSLSHSIAILALAEQKQLNFTCGEVKFTIDVDELRTEDVKIQLSNRDTFDYYYPDLICQFSSPQDLAEKWGGKVALEVKQTHACEPEKIHDFKNHCIPIIEIDIEKWSIEKKYETKSPSPEQLEDYFYFWKNVFSKNIFGKILSDPVTPQYYEKKEIEFKSRIESLQSQNKQLADGYQGVKKQVLAIEAKNTRLTSNIDSLNEKHVKEVKELNALINDKNSAISILESRGLFDFIKQAFKVN